MVNSLWFVSDLHFGHQNILKYCSRPFVSVKEMDQAIVDNWNETVRPNDTVYLLGDLAFHNYERIGQLNGYKILVPGNHDHERAKKVFAHVQEVKEEVEYLKVDKEHRFVLCHYPFESWRREYRFHLHGHSHGMSQPKMNRLDVGIDATGLYRPLSFDEVVERLLSQE